MSKGAKNTISTVIPAMRYRDAAAAIDWLCAAFGFEKHLVVPGENGTVAHAQLVFGNGMIMLGSARDDQFGRWVKPPQEVGGPGTQSAYVIVDDADAPTRGRRPPGRRSSWKLPIKITGAASTPAAIRRGICGVSAPMIHGRSANSGLLSAAAAFDYHPLMSIDRAPGFHYRLGLNQPSASPTVERLTEMAEAIGRETEGELLVEVFPESRLGPDPKMFTDLRSGALELFMAGATLGEVAPTSALPLLPFAFRDSKAVFKALDGALGDQIRSELAQHGIHAFRCCLQNGFHHLTTSNRPIETAADLAGVKIRSPGGAIARDFFETFGAEAGYVPFSRMYAALEARDFDGQSDPLGVVLSLRLYEVQSYLSLTAHWWSGFTLLANGAAWRALPHSMQEVVEHNAEKYALLQRDDIEQVNATGAEELARRGIQVNTADTETFRARLGGFYARWRERAGPAGWRLLESYAGEIRG